MTDSFSLAIRQELAGVILPYAIGDLSGLSNYLLGESYLQTDVDNFVEDWAAAFAYIPLSEIHQLITANDTQVAFTGLLSPALSSNMVASAVDYYDGICASVFQGIVGALGNQPQYQTTLVEICDDIQRFVLPWVFASYLQSLAALNGIVLPPPPNPPAAFDEYAMAEEAVSVAVVSSLVNNMGFAFRFFPDRKYRNFWINLNGDLDGIVNAMTQMVLIFKMGNLSHLSKALVREEYPKADADDFVQNMAEVFANKSIDNIRYAMLLPQQERMDLLADWLAMPSVARTDIKDMVEIVLDYYGRIYSFFVAVPSPEDYAVFSWVIASYLHYLAEMNGVAFVPGSPDAPLAPLDDAQEKEELTTLGIQVGYAAAEAAEAEEWFYYDPEEFDEEELDIDPGVMQSLIDSILPYDMSDLSTLLCYLWTSESMGVEYYMTSLLLLIALGSTALEFDVNDLADVVSVLLEEGAIESLADELAEQDEIGLNSTARPLLIEAITYLVDICDAERQEAEQLFDPGDETLDFILPWVSSLNIQSIFGSIDLGVQMSSNMSTKEALSEFIGNAERRSAPAASARTQAPNTLAEEAHEKISAGFAGIQSALYEHLQEALAAFDKKQEPGVVGRVLGAVSRAASKCSDPYELEIELKNMKEGNTVYNYQPQGLAAGTTYNYSFETKSDTYHKIWRHHKANGTLTEMTVKSGYSTPTLKHANDVALAAFKENNVDKLFMYVVTYKTYEIVKLEYDGNGNYWQRARYTYSPVKNKAGYLVDGTGFINGISLIGNTNNNEVEFMLQAIETFYTVKIGFNDPGGPNNPITPRYAFTVAKPAGGRQTFHYDRSDKIYVIWAGQNKNRVHAYKGIAAAIAKNDTQRLLTPTIASFDNWNANSSNTTFEVEGGGLYGGTYWFSTYEGKSTDGGENGGIYTYPKIN